MSVHKPFIGTSPVVFVKWKCCAWTCSSGGQVSCCARCTTTLDLPSFFLTRGRNGSCSSMMTMPITINVSYNSTLHKGCAACDFVVWTEWNLHKSTSLSMTHSCKLSFHKLKTFSNYAFYQNLYEGSLLKTMVVKYPVMLLMNLKWGKIVEYAWCYCNQVVVTWFSATTMVVVVSFGMPVYKWQNHLETNWLYPTCHAFNKRDKKSNQKCSCQF